jgi:predicted metal-dependent peptidase
MSLTNGNDPVKLNISKARLRLLFSQVFFGTLAMQLKLVDATDAGWCPTAAVDGRNIFYNRKFFGDLDVEELVFVFCHEILHVALDHFGRRAHRDPEWWNMANDYVINGMLVTEKIGKMPTKKVEDPNAKANGSETSQRVGLYDAKYIGWTSEAVYDDLEKRKVKKQLTLDVHIEMGDDANDGKGKKANTGIPVEISGKDLKQIREEVKNKVLQAAQAAAGKLPASLKRLVDDLVEPMINWKTLLEQNIQSCIVDDFSWTKPNRRHMYTGIFLPTLTKDDTIDLQIAIDVSGSITDKMAMEFISEIYGIMGMYHSFKIGILCFDTQIYNYQEFTEDTKDELLSYECTGGGGTDFSSFWNYWIEHELEPKKAVIFTDGFNCSANWGPTDYCDTLWIITEGAKTRVMPPFGQYAYFSSEDGVDEVGSV